jgi:hypothetical protein
MITIECCLSFLYVGALVEQLDAVQGSVSSRCVAVSAAVGWWNVLFVGSMPLLDRNCTFPGAL